MIEKRSSWESLGYEVSGELNAGSSVVLTRPAENSPNRLPTIYTGPQALITLKAFQSKDNEFEWIGNSIHDDIKNQLVAANQIIVISLDSTNARDYLPRIKRQLKNLGISSTIPGFDDDKSEFGEEGKVTLSTVYRAKGNEGAIVYIAAFETLYQVAEKAMPLVSIWRAFFAIIGAGFLDILR